MKTPSYFLLLTGFILFFSCKKDEVQSTNETETGAQVDYRDCYEGIFDVDYHLVTYTGAPPPTVDTTAEQFVGVISKYGDSSISISGASFGDFTYKVDTNGGLTVCAGTSAGTIDCDSLNAQYILNGFTCPTLPNQWSGHYTVSAVKQ